MSLALLSCIVALQLLNPALGFQASPQNGLIPATPKGNRGLTSCRRVCQLQSRSSTSQTLRMAGSDEADIDMSAFFSEVDKRSSEAAGGSAIDGPELKKLVMDKWKYPLDTRIHRRRDALGQMTVWLQVMWKHVWEASFPMTEEEYDAQLDAVAWYLTEWGKADFVRQQIAETDQSPGLNQSGKGKSVLIKLDVTAAQQSMMFDDAE